MWFTIWVVIQLIYKTTDSNSREYNERYNDYSDCKSSKDRKYSGLVFRPFLGDTEI